ncbi:MAG: biotin/lipoyl-binding protein [bacterium]|nr:biotin/lipoyl-binding protein [bacterium]
MEKKIILLITSLLFGLGVFASPEINLKKGSKPQVAQVASMYKGVVVLYVKLGQKVKKGQLLFGVNADILKAQLEKDKNDVINREIIFKAAKQLVAKSSISYDDYQQSIRDYLAAKNSYNKHLAQIRLSKFYSPFDGTVTNIVRYNGSGLNDNDTEVEVAEGNVKVDTLNKKALVCNRWPGLLELKVELGQKVKKGQLLFVIDTADIVAQLKKDKNYLKYADEDYQRLKKLNRSKTVSKLKFIESKIRYKDTLAEVKIHILQIKQSSGYAPFDGTVTKIYRYTGSGNSAGKPVLTITAEK